MAMVYHFVKQRYVVKARRNESERWTDWSETSSEEVLEHQKEVISSLGYQYRVIDRGEGQR